MNHEVVSYDAEPPSHMEMFVGMIRKTMTEDQIGWLQSITIRMPINLACTLEALAKYSGHSRNKLCVKVRLLNLDNVD